MARRNAHPLGKPAGLSPSDLPGAPNQRPTSPIRVAGVALKGKVMATLVAGQVVYEASGITEG